MPPGREHSLGLDDDFASSLPVPPRQQPALPTVPPTTKCKQDPQLVRRVVDLAKNGATLSDIDAALHAEGFCNSIGTLNRKQMAPVVRRRGALAYPLCCGHCRPKQGFGAAAAASYPSGSQAAGQQGSRTNHEGHTDMAISKKRPAPSAPSSAPPDEVPSRKTPRPAVKDEEDAFQKGGPCPPPPPSPPRAPLHEPPRAPLPQPASSVLPDAPPPLSLPAVQGGAPEALSHEAEPLMSSAIEPLMSSAIEPLMSTAIERLVRCRG
jgi:hypothetical protein